MRIVKYKTKLNNEGIVTLEKESSTNNPHVHRILDTPEKIHRFARDGLKIHEMSEEYAYLICMTGTLKFTSVFEISHGTVNATIVNAREVYQKALLANAVAVAVTHNHPSGNVEPSKEDILLTKRLYEAGNLLNVYFTDHIIVGRGDHDYCSLKQKGLF